MVIVVVLIEWPCVCVCVCASGHWLRGHTGATRVPHKDHAYAVDVAHFVTRVCHEYRRIGIRVAQLCHPCA